MLKFIINILGNNRDIVKCERFCTDDNIPSFCPKTIQLEKNADSSQDYERFMEIPTWEK